MNTSFDKIVNGFEPLVFIYTNIPKSKLLRKKVDFFWKYCGLSVILIVFFLLNLDGFKTIIEYFVKCVWGCELWRISDHDLVFMQGTKLFSDNLWNDKGIFPMAVIFLSWIYDTDNIFCLTSLFFLAITSSWPASWAQVVFIMLILVLVWESKLW